MSIRRLKFHYLLFCFPSLKYNLGDDFDFEKVGGWLGLSCLGLEGLHHLESYNIFNPFVWMEALE
jgi:hypothetical protein